MRIFLLLCFLTISSLVYGTQYYVSSSGGNDGLDGLTQATAWKTLAKVNSSSFSAGDIILLKRGDTWREILQVPSSGTSGSYITFGNYGSGADPQIYGSEESASWTNNGGNLWVSNSSFVNPRSRFLCEIFFIETNNTITWGLYKSSTASLTTEHDWTWSGNKIYVYSATDPGSRYTGIEIPQRQTCIDLNNKQYIDIDGIDLYYGIYEGVTYDWSYDQLDLRGLIIENCTIGYIGGNISVRSNENGYGIDVAYSDMIVRNCEIYNCGRRGISFHLYGSGFTVKNVLIEQNYFHDGHHTTGVDISVGSGSYTGSFDGITIRRNQFYDPPTSPFHSVQIFIQNYNYAGLQTKVNNVLIYSNIFKTPTASSIQAEGAQSVFIYNNTFYNHNTITSGNVVHIWLDKNNASIKVKNNIFYSELSNDNSGNGLELYSLTDYKKIDANYNLYYRINNSLRIILANATNYSISNFASVRSQLGWEINSPDPANPLFVSGTDYHLQSSSPAAGKGLLIPEVTTDYDGNSFGNTPNIGCYGLQIPVVTTPVYSSSAVRDATPTYIDMTYTVTLANVVPDISSFEVLVNSTVRSIKSVAIVSGHVQLEVSTPILNGDVVTVSYTKPSSNPLQTSAGAEAASISLKPVINLVLSIIPVYSSSGIENATPAYLDILYDQSLAAVVPAAAAFAVEVNSSARSILSVQIIGTKVRLVLSSPVVYGDVVRVSYTAPSIDPVQSSKGGLAASFSLKSVTNNVLSVIPVYVKSVVENATPDYIDITYSFSLADQVPAVSAFTVQVNSQLRSINSVSIVGGKVRLILSTSVIYGDIVKVSYTQPSANPLKSVYGGLAESIGLQTVTNNLLSINPVYVSSVVENASPGLLSITFNLPLANVVPDNSAFVVLVNTVNRTINSVLIEGSNVRLTLSDPVAFGDIVEVSYTKPATNFLQTASSGEADSFANKQVTNSVLSSSPVYVSSVLENSAPSIIEMTYSLTLSDVTPAVSAFTVNVNSVIRNISEVNIIRGRVQITLSSPVAANDIVEISYTKPSSNPLQSLAGGQAASIGFQNVINNVATFIPEYVSSSVENATPTYIDLTYSLLLADVVPSVTSFKVRVNSENRIINSVEIVSGKVRLVLSGPVFYGDIVEISYSKPSVKALQASSGEKASSTGLELVTNNVLPEKPEYLNSVINNITPDLLVVTYNLPLENNIVPPDSLFSVSVNNSIQEKILSVAINNNKVELLMSQAVTSNDVVTLSYFRPSLKDIALQTHDGGVALSISQRIVTNYVMKISDFNRTNSDYFNQNITIYPNPTQGYYNISFVEPYDNPLVIRLINSSGSIMSEKQIQAKNNFIQIPLTVPAGIYYIQFLLNGQNLGTKKLIVQ